MRGRRAGAASGRGALMLRRPAALRRRRPRAKKEVRHWAQRVSPQRGDTRAERGDRAACSPDKALLEEPAQAGGGRARQAPARDRWTRRREGRDGARGRAHWRMPVMRERIADARRRDGAHHQPDRGPGKPIETILAESARAGAMGRAIGAGAATHKRRRAALTWTASALCRARPRVAAAGPRRRRKRANRTRVSLRWAVA